jgi:hypothetical protein
MQDGVLNRSSRGGLSSTSLHRSSSFTKNPEWSLGSRGSRGTTYIHSNGNPAPNSYTAIPDDKEKFKSAPKFSFGGQSRFGLESSPVRRQPGPGAYRPRDVAGEVSNNPKIGFGSTMRFKTTKFLAQGNPGPGAYENAGKLGDFGVQYKMQGPHSATYNPVPGPGAYEPSDHPTYQAAPKVGFGTQKRSGEDGAAKRRNLANPGPGAYELQYFKRTGSEASKFSIISRRHIKDLDPYMTPGPGSYNSHVTSFGADMPDHLLRRPRGS